MMKREQPTRFQNKKNLFKAHWVPPCQFSGGPNISKRKWGKKRTEMDRLL